MNEIEERLVGSSPLARGLRTQQNDLCDSAGIIPARAGFTSPSSPPATGARDHPRSRGVYSIKAIWSPCVTGSSPLARGLPAPRWLRPAGRWIIPARAGFTGARPTEAVHSADHPRSRGVYMRVTRIDARFRGSSPLARGLQYRSERGGHRMGIIPARAGFTSNTAAIASPSWDHPRSRGVYESRRLAISATKGSSPLARGLLLLERLSDGFQGIIPARAGFTCGSHRLMPAAADHPRSRGVYHG